MALASYGKPRLPRRAARADPRHRRRRLPHRDDRLRRARAAPAARARMDRRRTPTSPPACSCGSRRCCSTWPAGCTSRPGTGALALAGGVALNCVANTRILAEGPFEQVWVQPAAGDAGTALGGALHVARDAGDGRRADARRRPRPRLDRRRARGRLRTAAMRLRAARPTWPTRWPRCWPPTASSPGSRAAASTARARSATGRCWPIPGDAENLERLNDVKGREQFRPVAPMVLAERAAEIFSRGPMPSPVHAVRARRARRSGATGSPPSCTSTAPPGCRPSTAATSRWSRRMLARVRAAHRPAGGGQHQPEHRRPADGGRPA